MPTADILRTGTGRLGILEAVVEVEIVEPCHQLWQGVKKRGQNRRQGKVISVKEESSFRVM